MADENPPLVGRRAAQAAAAKHAMRIDVPVLGPVTLPPSEQLALIAGLSVLAGLEVIAWPIAAVLSFGHILASSEHHRLLRDFGAALEEA